MQEPWFDVYFGQAINSNAECQGDQAFGGRIYFAGGEQMAVSLDLGYLAASQEDIDTVRAAQNPMGRDRIVVAPLGRNPWNQFRYIALATTRRAPHVAVHAVSWADRIAGTSRIAPAPVRGDGRPGMCVGTWVVHDQATGLSPASDTGCADPGLI